MPVKKYSKKSPVRRIKKYVKKYSKRVSNNVARAIKSISLKNAETKFYSNSVENVNLYHNGGTAPIYNTVGNLLNCPVGTTQLSRVGDSVIGRGLSVNLWLSNKLDRPNVMYRIYLFTAAHTDYSLSSPTGFFQGLHGNKMIDYMNTDRYKIIYHKIIRPFSGDYSLESGATNKEHSTQLKIYIPLKNRLIKYQTDGGAIPSYQGNLINMGIIAYDAYGTLLTDAIASYSYVTKFYFKDP